MAGADPVLLCFYKLSILGSLVGGQEDVDEALDFAARGLIKPKITILPFAQLPEGVARLVRPPASSCNADGSPGQESGRGPIGRRLQPLNKRVSLPVSLLC